MSIYRTAHPVTTKNTYFSSVYGAFININHILGCEASFHKFRIKTTFICHSVVDLEINNRKKAKKKIHIYFETKKYLK